MSQAEFEVTSLVLTYNHAPFIRDALTSVFAQRTSFSHEVLIADDASTDGTSEIVSEFADAHPGVCTALVRPVNMGGAGAANLLDAFTRCRGRFIAFLEGDDAWLSTDKLEKQFETLARHPALAGCYHDARIVSDDGTVIEESYTLPHPPELSVPYLLLNGKACPTSSLMFRSDVLLPPPPWYADVPTDAKLELLLVAAGGLRFVPGILGIYRVHGEGLWGALDSRDRLDFSLRILANLASHEPFATMFQRELKERRATLLLREARTVRGSQGLMKGLAALLPYVTAHPRASMRDLAKVARECLGVCRSARATKRAAGESR